MKRPSSCVGSAAKRACGASNDRPLHLLDLPVEILEDIAIAVFTAADCHAQRLALRATCRTLAEVFNHALESTRMPPHAQRIAIGYRDRNAFTIHSLRDLYSRAAPLVPISVWDVRNTFTLQRCAELIVCAQDVTHIDEYSLRGLTALRKLSVEFVSSDRALPLAPSFDVGALTGAICNTTAAAVLEALRVRAPNPNTLCTLVYGAALHWFASSLVDLRLEGISESSDLSALGDLYALDSLTLVNVKAPVRQLTGLTALRSLAIERQHNLDPVCSLPRPAHLRSLCVDTDCAAPLGIVQQIQVMNALRELELAHCTFTLPSRAGRRDLERLVLTQCTVNGDPLSPPYGLKSIKLVAFTMCFMTYTLFGDLFNALGDTHRSSFVSLTRRADSTSANAPTVPPATAGPLAVNATFRRLDTLGA